MYIQLVPIKLPSIIYLFKKKQLLGPIKESSVVGEANIMHRLRNG